MKRISFRKAGGTKGLNNQRTTAIKLVSLLKLEIAL